MRVCDIQAAGSGSHQRKLNLNDAETDLLVAGRARRQRHSAVKQAALVRRDHTEALLALRTLVSLVWAQLHWPPRAWSVCGRARRIGSGAAAVLGLVLERPGLGSCARVRIRIRVRFRILHLCFRCSFVDQRRERPKGRIGVKLFVCRYSG